MGPKVPMAAKWSGDAIFTSGRRNSAYIMLDKIITNLKDRYDNKESSVIYDMATEV